MAGIGFELNRLASQDNIKGLVGAFLHAAFATAGPWLFTVIALAIITLLYGGVSGNLELLTFRGIIVYNFSFSLVLSAPVFMIMTRYLADQIHVKDVTAAPTVMMETLILTFIFQLPVAIFFYAFYFDMPIELRLAGFANMFLIAATWLLAVFLTALKDYVAVTWAYLVGLTVGIVCSYFMNHHGAVGMLVGFNIGLAIIVFWLCARILSEYPYKLTTTFSLKPYMKRYWELALAGLFYNAAIWVDKWIMWFAPEATVLPSNLRFYPEYDSAMFLATLTLVPTFALFVFNVETQFFHHYRRFYMQILEHAALKRIRYLHSKINESIYEGARNLIFMQGAVCLLAILLAPQILEALETFFMQLGIFRLGVLGAFFHGLLLFGTIILQYFDCRKSIMWTYLYFFLSNALFTTFVMIAYGFEYYGYGYFMSSASSFALGGWVLFRHVRRLPYHAFISNNNSVKSRIKTTATERHHEVWV
ncbi:MAG: exopolysaccharide Pel transporter PelG [Rickettsiales bacterium]|nr:exopolysaccharide Pel transporter PelG [Rickettsiales bacterium]